MTGAARLARSNKADLDATATDARGVGGQGDGFVIQAGPGAQVEVLFEDRRRDLRAAGAIAGLAPFGRLLV